MVSSKASRATESSETTKRRYKGVRMRSWGSWVSEIRAPNQKARIWLGSYSTPEAASRAYEAALRCTKNTSSVVMSPKSIQKIAAAAAAMESCPASLSSGTPTEGPSSCPESVDFSEKNFWADSLLCFNEEEVNQSLSWCNFSRLEECDGDDDGVRLWSF